MAWPISGKQFFIPEQVIHMIFFSFSQCLLGFYLKPELPGSAAFIKTAAFVFWHTHTLQVWTKSNLREEIKTVEHMQHHVWENKREKKTAISFLNLMISELIWQRLSHDFQIFRTGNISEKGCSELCSALPLNLLPAPELSYFIFVWPLWSVYWEH